MIKSALIGTVGALIGVAIAYIVGDAVSGPILVTPPGADAAEEVGLGVSLLSTVFGAVAGLGLAVVSKRFLGLAAFLGTCLAGLIVSGVVAFVAGEGVASGVWLNVMHVAAAVPIVGSLARSVQGPKTS